MATKQYSEYFKKELEDQVNILQYITCARKMVKWVSSYPKNLKRQCAEIESADKRERYFGPTKTNLQKVHGFCAISIQINLHLIRT